VIITLTDGLTDCFIFNNLFDLKPMLSLLTIYKPEKGILKVSQCQKGSNHYEGDKIVCDTSAQKIRISREQKVSKSPSGSPGELDNIYTPEHILRK